MKKLRREGGGQRRERMRKINKEKIEWVPLIFPVLPSKLFVSNLLKQ